MVTGVVFMAISLLGWEGEHEARDPLNKPPLIGDTIRI